jgi:hypothetical protein
MSQTITVKIGLSADLQVQEHNGVKTLHRTDGKDTLPGQARIKLQSPSFKMYLRKSHLVTELDRLAPYLKFVTTTPKTTSSPHH